MGRWAAFELGRMGRSGFFHVLGAQGIARIVTVIQGLILARILTREDLGRYAVFSSVLAIGGIISQAGIPSALSRFTTLANSDYQRERLKNSAVMVSILWSLIIGVVLGFSPLSHLLSTEPWIWRVLPLSLIILPLGSLTQACLSWLHGMNRLKRKSLLESVSSISTLVIVLGSAAVWEVSGAALGRAIAVLASGLLLIVATRTKPGFHGGYPPGFWRYACFSLLSASFSTMIHTADTLVLSALRIDSGIIGDYRVAAMVYMGLSMIPSAAMHTVFPSLVRLFGEGQDLSGRYRSMVIRLVGYGIGMGVIGILVVPQVVVVVLGSKYAGSSPFIRILSAGLPFRALVLCAGSMILAMGKPALNFSLLILSGSANIALNIGLVSRIGAEGAAWATLTTEFLSAMGGTAAVIIMLKGKRRE